MAPRTRRTKRSRRAIVGIEAAIVLIAFVIVASALAFVALNMGFFATQKSKEVITTGLGEASSALEVEGCVLGIVNATTSQVMGIAIPVRLAPGKEPVDLTPGRTTIGFWFIDPEGSKSKAYADIYRDANITPGTSDVYTLWQYTYDKYVKPGTNSYNVTSAVVYWVTKINDDKVLDYGEKILVIIALMQADWLNPYSTFKVEIRPPVGSPMTVARSIPPSLTSQIVDLG